MLKYNMDNQFKDSVRTETHIISKEEEVELEKADNPEKENIYFDPSAKGVQEGFKYCRNCGNKLPADAKFCDKCGMKIDY